MAGKPLTSPRGLWGANELTVGSTVGLGRFLAPVAALPSTDKGIAVQFVSNSTGVALAINSTGTTWAFLNTTSVQPT